MDDDIVDLIVSGVLQLVAFDGTFGLHHQFAGNGRNGVYAPPAWWTSSVKFAVIKQAIQQPPYDYSIYDGRRAMWRRSATDTRPLPPTWRVALAEYDNRTGRRRGGLVAARAGGAAGAGGAPAAAPSDRVQEAVRLLAPRVAREGYGVVGEIGGPDDDDFRKLVEAALRDRTNEEFRRILQPLWPCACRIGGRCGSRSRTRRCSPQ